MSETNSKAAIGIHHSRYARDRRELISLMDRMRAAGVSTEIDLPRIAIIGNQSAGKNGKALARIREIPFGDELSSPEKVEGALRRAQLAILNPSVSPHAFVTATEADVSLAKGGQLILGSTNQLSFSSNLICIDIEGPQVTDLAFLDLPGIISNVDEGEDENNIDLIKSMVDRVITGNCLILLTLSMRDDIENQSAMRHARAADPEGKRTIGVLTKADTLQEGEHHRWIQILEGQRAKLSNGYFATKLPGAADLDKNLTFDAAREAEKNFFISTAPWSTISPDLRRRLGIPHLTSYLSDKLSSYIKTKLPEIRKVVNEGLAYRTDLDAYVAGSQGFEALIQEKNRIQYCFANNIRETRPRLYPLTAYEASGSKQNLRRRFKLLDCSDPSEEVELCVDNDDCKNYVLELALDDVTERIERLRTRELPLNIPFSAKSSLMVESTKGWSKITANALDALREPIADVLNDLVEQYFGRYSESGLTAAAKEIVETVSAQLFSETELRLKHLIELETTPFTLNNHYYEATLEKVRADLKQQRQLLDKSESPAKKVAMPTVDVAKATPEQPRDLLPPTPAPSTAIAVPNGFSFTFKEQSKEPEKSKGEQEKLRAALAALAALGYNVQEEDLPKLLPPDEFTDELDVMSHVMANWKVAYKRIIDNVPRFVDYDVLQKLPLAVSTAFAQLASGGSNGAAHYLREGLEVQELRSELTTKLTRITEAKQLLSAFGRH